MGQRFIKSLDITIIMHGLQHHVVKADAARRPVRKSDLPFGPGWVPPGALEKLRREQGSRKGVHDQPTVPLYLPLEEPSAGDGIPPVQKSDRGVVILQM